MCGIIGYIGQKNAVPLIIDGLNKMEYRGYDSAGIAFIKKDKNKAQLIKSVGRIFNLQALLKGTENSNCAIGHTRWATHGGVTTANAHPHSDCSGNIFLAHNGIIENFDLLKKELEEVGHDFKSETDTEVLAHLIEETQKKYPKNSLSLEETVRVAFQKIRGTYGVVVMDKNNPDEIVAVRNFSPLILGIMKDGMMIASDASAIVRNTRDVVHLEDGEMAVIKSGSYEISGFDRSSRHKKLETIDWEDEDISKGGFEHFMLKEIMEIPSAVENTTRGRLHLGSDIAKLGGVDAIRHKIQKAHRVIMTACGTSYYAGLLGKYILEEYAGIPTTVELASELRYRRPVLKASDIMIAISQSGETADTLASLVEAKNKGVTTLGIVNVVGSSIARKTHAGIYQHIGPEIAVASTKAFISQVTILTMLATIFGETRSLSPLVSQNIIKSLMQLPELMRQFLTEREKVNTVAQAFKRYDNFFYLGRNYHAPVALEGALKLKEVSYVHAEGYPAGEMKHGPIAMLSPDLPCVVLAPRDAIYDKMLSNIQELKARGAPIIAITTPDGDEVKRLADYSIEVPKTIDVLQPLVSILPLQLFAYYSGVARGLDVDKPRNLAKSVTVE